MTWPATDPPGRSACGAPATWSPRRPDRVSRGRQFRRRTRFRVGAAAVASRVSGEVGSDIAGGVALHGSVRPRRRRPAAPRPGAEFGVRAALAVQVGGTLRRVGEVRRFQEQGFRSRGIDGHGSPPGWGLLSMPRSGEKCLADFELFSQGLAEPGPGVLPVPVGHRPGEPQRRRPPPRRRARRTGAVGRPVRRRRLPPRAGSAVRPATGEVGILGEGTDLIEQLEPDPPAARFSRPSIPSMVDQDAPHGLGRGGEEVPAVVELLVCPSTSRRYASWTRAVALSVCPGFSAAILAAASLRSSS